MFMFMVVLMIMVGLGTRFAPGAPEHPAAIKHNDNPGNQLKLGLKVWVFQPHNHRPAAGDQPDHRRMRNRGRQPQQYPPVLRFSATPR